MSGAKRYWAFISYSHADRAWADWLHKALERYVVPLRVRRGANAGQFPPRLTPIFLDRLDLAAGPNIDESIASALYASRHLIVICSPAAARSDRVAAEIELFRAHSGNRILCLIVAGRPDAVRRGAQPGEECIPAQLRRADLITATGPVMPLAADVRAGKGGRQEGLLKLIAGMLNVDLDQLRQRDMQRRRSRWIAAAAALAVVMLGALALALFAWNQRDAALAAQSRLLAATAAQKFKDEDVDSAQAIILEVLKSPHFDARRNPTALDVFQQIRGIDRQLAVLPDPGQHFVRSAFYSPDGTHIVTASYDATAHTWDSRTGLPLVTLSGHTGLVRWAAYSPDGKRIVTASVDGTARTWDATSGLPLLSITGHTEGLFCAAFSPDGALLVTTSTDKTARIWDANTGAPLRILSGHTDVVFSAAFSPDGKRVVTGSLDRTARVWDAATGAPLLVLKGHGANVFSVAYSPDGKRIVTGSLDTTARVWDAVTGTSVAVLAGHRKPIEYAAFSPDNARVVTAADDGVRIWDVGSETQLAVLADRGQGYFTASYSPDGTRILTSSQDKTARIWDAASSTPPAVLAGHRRYVYSAAYAPDGKHVVSASFDRTARVWDTQTGRTTLVLAGHTGYVFRAAYSPDGHQIATVSYDHTARIWNAATGSTLRELRGHQANIYGVAYSPDGSRIVTTSADSTIRVWDAQSGETVMVLSGQHGLINTAAFSPDGMRIATASSDGTARIWSARTGAPELVLSGHAEGLGSAAFSPDGAKIVTASTDKTVRIWDARTGRQLLLILCTAVANAAAFSPDAAQIVTGSEDGNVRVWNATTGSAESVLSGHGDSVSTVEYSPDGTHIVSASDDGTARVWKVPTAADIPMQITWSEAAQTHPLSNESRADLGLPLPSLSWHPSPRGSKCDAAAGAFYDPRRRAAGQSQSNIVGPVAAATCMTDGSENPVSPRTHYEVGRALLAQRDTTGASREFDRAIAAGYGAAGVDLADLLASSPGKALRPERLVSLYESAWATGVSIASFRLGQLYEHGLAGAAAAPPDPVQAWAWYQRGADIGDPNALARLAARAESVALTEPDSQRRNSQLLRAFEFYAAASERARSEDWPDDAWRTWRLRRATLARLLAHDGWMPQVVASFDSVRHRWAPTRWQSIKAALPISGD